MQKNRITSSYLHALQAVYYDIGDRGIRVDPQRIAKNKIKVSTLIQEQLDIASKQWGIIVYIGAANDPGKDIKSVNLNSTSGESSLLKMMQSIGYHVPKITKKNEEGEYEQKYSTGELALQKMLAENQFKHPAGDPAIRAILKVRELGKLQNGYLNTRFCPRTNKTGELDFFFLSTYNVAGTVTGRRGSKRHTFGFGNNAQNFPSHSESAKYIRECLVPRRGNIFLMVDQIQAEEWPVSALSANQLALDELRTNYLPDYRLHVDRHSNLASKIFNTRIPWKVDPDWDGAKHGMMRYLGKKSKHAKNYGMRANRMSESLAQEGFKATRDECQIILDMVSKIDPSVEGVFHKYIQNEISNTHMLKTPLGRERMFLGARPNADNNTLFNEAYAYIPQSTVGDNTGLAVYELETTGQDTVVQEGHDSLVHDILDDKINIRDTLEKTIQAFDREITFHNGITINIPIEAELGYSFEEKVTLHSMDLKGIEQALDKLRAKREEKLKVEAA